MAGWIVECTITSAPWASFSTCSDADEDRGGNGTSLPASPPITTLPAGVSTRYDTWPAICVERTALTLTSPESQTVCGSSLASKFTVLIKSAGPPAVRSLISEWRCATSPDWINESATWAVNFWQLIVKPSVETTSELQTASILGPLPKNIHRNVTRSAKPSVWSVCICVKNTAFNCSGVMPSSARRIVVPRPLSNCNFTAEQLLASSP